MFASRRLMGVAAAQWNRSTSIEECSYWIKQQLVTSNADAGQITCQVLSLSCSDIQDEYFVDLPVASKSASSAVRVQAHILFTGVAAGRLSSLCKDVGIGVVRAGMGQQEAVRIKVVVPPRSLQYNITSKRPPSGKEAELQVACDLQLAIVGASYASWRTICCYGKDSSVRLRTFSRPFMARIQL